MIIFCLALSKSSPDVAEGFCTAGWMGWGPSVQNWNVILLARLGTDLAFSMNGEREALVLVLTAFKRLCLNVFPVLLQHTTCNNTVCVAVCVYKFISADYTGSGQHLNSFGMLNLPSLYCILYLLPFVVLTVLYVVACIYSFWHSCFSPRSQTTAVSHSLHMALSSKNLFLGVAWCFCMAFLRLLRSSGMVSMPRVAPMAFSRVVLLSVLQGWDCWSGWDQWHYASLVTHVQFPPQNRAAGAVSRDSE